MGVSRCHEVAGSILASASIWPNSSIGRARDLFHCKRFMFDEIRV